MKKSIEQYWAVRLKQTREALEKNNFEVFLAEDENQARDMVLKEIIPKIKPKSLSWGGSMTFVSSGLHDALKKDKHYEVLDTFNKKLPKEEMGEMRRRALLVAGIWPCV